MANYSKLLSLISGADRTVDFSLAGNILELGGSGLQMDGSTSGHVSISASATTTTYSMIWPPAQAASSGFVLSNDGTGVLSWVSASAGSVSSVALSLPSSVFAVSGSPVTSTGTLTGTFQNQTANQVFSGPATGSAAAPTFRSLVAADIPSLSGVYANINLSNLATTSLNQDLLPSSALGRNLGSATLPFLGTYTNAVNFVTISGSPLSIGTMNCSASGILIDTVSGTNTNGINIETGNATGTSGNITLQPGLGATVGNIILNAPVTQFMNANGGIIGQSAGGTGSYNIVWPTAQGGASTVLQNNGSGVLSWASASSGTVTSVALGVPAGTFLAVSGSPITTSGTLQLTFGGGALPVPNGGTGNTSLPAHSVLLGAGTGNIASVSPGAVGSILQGLGASTDPIFASAIQLGIGGTTSGSIALANGSSSGALVTIQNLGATTAYNFNLPATPGSAGQVLTSEGGGSNSMIWSSAATGSVTSVAFADDSTTPIYAVSGSPVTTSGTLGITLQTQSANTIFSGPTSGSAAQPGFRTLVAADIPSLSGVYANVNLSNLSAPTAFNVDLIPASALNLSIGTQAVPLKDVWTKEALFETTAGTIDGTVFSDGANFNFLAGSGLTSKITTQINGSGGTQSTIITTGDAAGSGASGNVLIEVGAFTGGATQGHISLDAAYVDANSTNIINLASPVNPNDAVNKAYVDNFINATSWKTAVLVATTANITLSGEQTIDGVTTSASRVLVKNQSAPANNGIYVSAAGAWARSTDMSTWAEVPAAAVFVESGTVNADLGWVCTSQPGGTLGTTAINFVQFSSAGAYSADNVTLQLISGVFSIKNAGVGTSQLGSVTDGVTLDQSGAGSTIEIKAGGVGTTQLAAASVTAAKLGAVTDGITADQNGAGSTIEVLNSPALKRSLVAGQSFAANTSYAVRWGLTANGETAGRVYAADTTTSSFDLFYVIGMASSATSVSAGQSIVVTNMGSFNLSSADSAFASGTDGEAVFLTASGTFSTTPPNVSGLAVTRIGMVQVQSATVGSNIIDVWPQVIGVN